MKYIGKAAAVILSLCLVLCLVPAMTANSSAKEDTISFGSYPRSRVTDSAVLSRLEGTMCEWKSFGYASGNGEKSSASRSDYMKYTDVVLDGVKYRGVLISDYRPMKTYENHSGKTYQDDNGYYKGEIYWFRFEPLKWRILNSSEGLLMCESIIDSQPFNETVYEYSGAYYADPSHTKLAHDYTESSLRKWLNEDFYLTAFTSEEQAGIKNSELEMQYYPSWKKSGNLICSDKVFLLSRTEATSGKYGFKTSMYAADSARRGRGTDYAQAQGLHVFEFPFPAHNGNSCWWLRAPSFFSKRVNKIFYDGYCAVDSYYYTGLTDIGVRPCIRISSDFLPL